MEIRGENLEAASAVFFGKIAATFKINSSEMIVALVPRWAETSIVTVAFPGGRASSATAFLVQNDPRVPEDVGWKSGYVNPVRPPAEFSSALLWGIAIADTREKDFAAAQVEIAATQLTCRVDGKDWVLNDDVGKVRGGLYARHPWFGGRDAHDAMPVENSASAQAVILRVGERPERIWHFWSTSPRAALPAGKLEGCTVKVRARISRGALVQIGMDYWRSPAALWAGPDVNNHEAGASDWYFPSEQWQDIVFTDIGGPPF